MWSRKICSTNKQKDCQIGELVVVIVCCAVSLAFERAYLEQELGFR